MYDLTRGGRDGWLLNYPGFFSCPLIVRDSGYVIASGVRVRVRGERSAYNKYVSRYLSVHRIKTRREEDGYLRPSQYIRIFTLHAEGRTEKPMYARPEKGGHVLKGKDRIGKAGANSGEMNFETKKRRVRRERLQVNNSPERRPRSNSCISFLPIPNLPRIWGYTFIPLGEFQGEKGERKQKEALRIDRDGAPKSGSVISFPSPRQASFLPNTETLNRGYTQHCPANLPQRTQNSKTRKKNGSKKKTESKILEIGATYRPFETLPTSHRECVWHTHAHIQFSATCFYAVVYAQFTFTPVLHRVARSVPGPKV